MLELISLVFPNFPKASGEFFTCILQTLQMVAVAGTIAFFLGLFLGIILVITDEGGIKENKVVYKVLDFLINTIRSIPFIILIILLIPYSRMLTGSAIGVKGAYLGLVVGTVPFFARQIETVLSEVHYGLIEAARAMGFSTMEIIIRVYLKESIPSIARVTTITAVNLVGLTAMAGTVGAGGLGDFAIRYGYQRFQYDLAWLTVIVILLIVSVIQAIGAVIIRKTTH